MSKICRRCKELKQSDSFGPDNRYQSGLKAICRACDNDIHKLRYQLFKDTPGGKEKSRRMSESSLKRFAAKKAIGECYYCSSPATPGMIRCDKHRRYAVERTTASRAEKRKTVFSAYGNKCACCGESNQKFLTIDHINNDGANHRRQIGGGRSSGNRILDWAVGNGFPDTLQLLCYNCNCGKQINKGICPHKSNPQPAVSDNPSVSDLP